MNIFQHGALADLKVVEYADFVSGPYCSKLLGDLGAEVIKVEDPKTCDRARREGPFPNDTPDDEQSGLFLFLNTNKLGVSIDVHRQKGANILRKLIQQADIFIENNQPRIMKKLGLDYQSLHAINQSLIMTSITPFGQTGPYRNNKGGDLIATQSSGLGYLTPDVVHTPLEQPPLRVGGHQADFVSGATGAMATMFAAISRRFNGEGQHVDVSQQEALISFIRAELQSYVYDRSGFYQTYAKRDAAHFTDIGYLPCKDGYIAMGIREEYHWQALMEGILGPDAMKDDRIQGVLIKTSGFNENIPMTSMVSEGVLQILRQWLKQHTKSEVYEFAKSSGIPLAPCNDVRDVINSDQLKARNYFVEVDSPSTGTITYSGAPFKYSKTPWQVQRSAPIHGEHNERILCGRLGYTKSDVMKLKDAGIV